MSAQNNLSKIQFKHTEGHDLHFVDAGDDADHGHIAWDKRSGRVDQIFVPEHLRRQGIATQLWDTAHSVAEQKGLVHPVHSDARTPEGDAWAKSVGGKLPKNYQCTTCGDYGHNYTEHEGKEMKA